MTAWDFHPGPAWNDTGSPCAGAAVLWPPILHYRVDAALAMRREWNSPGAGSGGVVAAALAWLVATVLVHRMPAPMGWLPAIALLAAAGGAWWLARWRWVLWFAAGALWTTAHIHVRLADWLPTELQGRDFAVLGWVDGFPNYSTGQVSFSFRVEAGMREGTVPEGTRGGTVPERLRLTWYDPPPDAVRPGSVLDLVVRLKRPRGLVNPGGFDYARWLFQEGYGATGYVREGRSPAAETTVNSETAETGGTRATRGTGRASGPGGAGGIDGAGGIGGTGDTGDTGGTGETDGIGGTGGIPRQWLLFRARLGDSIRAAAVTPDAAALQVALSIGERFGFEDSHWRTLQRTGTSHLVAISGLHVGLVAGLIFLLARSIALRMPVAVASRNAEVAASACLLAAGLYAALAGFTVPTQRALIMLAVAQLALLSRRSVSMSSGLSAAVLLVLAWDPAAPLSASFWLSFIAVALLWQLARSEYPREGNREALRPVAGVARVQWYMSLGLVPVTALFFNEVSLISPFVNVIAIPLFSFVLVPLTLLAAAAAYLHPVGGFLVSLAGMPLQWTWNALAAVGEWSWSSVLLSPPPVWILAIAVIGTFAAMAAWPLPARNLAWLALAPILWWEPARPDRGGAVVDVLDVGHGLAVLVETRSRTLLYDAGALYRSGFDSGREIVVPAMRAKAWETLDTLVVSHADNDHAGGVPAVLEAFPDAKVLMGPDVELPGGEVCRTGQAWTWDEVRFEILHPGPAFHYRGNDSSCVLKVTTLSGSLLLTGDVERAGERALMADASSLSSDVVVAPHHGSATSSSLPLVTTVAPDHAVVSAGHLNHWGFPKPQVVERWRHAGATMLTTGDSGAITVTFEPGEPVLVQALRSGRRRYWNPPD